MSVQQEQFQRQMVDMVRQNLTPVNVDDLDKIIDGNAKICKRASLSSMRGTDTIPTGNKSTQ